MVRRTLLALSAVVVLTAGCHQAPAAPGTQNDSNSVTVVCGATEEWCQAMTTAFTRDTGVGARFVRLSSGEALARIRAGKADPEFDVWHGGPADGYATAAADGLLEAYASPNAQAIAATYKDPAGFWTGVYVGALGFCNNTKVLADKQATVPRSWADLLQPALSKNIALAHPGTSGTAYTALWTQVARNGGDVEAAKQYVTRLHGNILQYPKTGVAPGQMAARGEIATGIVFAHDCVTLQDEGFKDLQVTFPAEGTGYEVGGSALIQGAKNPVSARKYLDWALTPKAQEVGPSAKSYQLPTNPSATVDPRVPDLASIKVVPYDVGAAGQAKPGLVKWFEENVAQAPKA
jgi:iron(III) transport system substrate-binding protein